mmetsp:Transcript_18559/g.38687  ORF Transcript_18559/g.38687 Transcript_18559/m.38687 type:complete len:93 (-) Transcript_18559:307-585(-)
MLLHFLAGIVLMTVGPIQLIPSFRRQFLGSHRFIGRIYIMAAMMASVCANLLVVIYGTSRGNWFEDAGNVVFGVLMFSCACQSYRHAAITKV